MGFSHSFIAARGVERAALLEQLALTETGETGDVDIALGGFGLSEFPDGWLIVACDEYNLLDRAPLAALSQSGEIVAARLEEHVMASEAAGFANGQEVWRVAYTSEDDPDNLRVTGTPPVALARLRDAALAEQAADGEGGGYLFETPLELATSLCGFAFGVSDGEFLELKRARRPRPPKTSREGPGFFARLFGRS
jgi:hypothetical protein